MTEASRSVASTRRAPARTREAVEHLRAGGFDEVAAWVDNEAQRRERVAALAPAAARQRSAAIQAGVRRTVERLGLRVERVSTHAAVRALVDKFGVMSEADIVAMGLARRPSRKSIRTAVRALQAEHDERRIDIETIRDERAGP